jgi:hypothetical protein
MPSIPTADDGDSIGSRLLDVRRRIDLAVARYRPVGARVTLVAVSKTRPPADVRAAAVLGQKEFGESYLQEALPKVEATRDLGLVWHFIGHLQSNKCRDVAEQFDWVHSIDRGKVARRLGEARSGDRPPVNLLIQVNLQGEHTKGGVEPAAVPRLAAEIRTFDNVALRGLMAIPAPDPDFERQRAVFGRLRSLADRLRDGGIDCDCLSMGMTADLEAAIAEGATHVRVGTAIFGPRPPGRDSYRQAEDKQ